MVRIMTDNAANLPKHLLEQYSIGELCLTYTIDGQPADINAEFDGLLRGVLRSRRRADD